MPAARWWRRSTSLLWWRTPHGILNASKCLRSFEPILKRSDRLTTKETRRRILAAASAEFAEKGFAGATTRAIADRAEVNEVTLFRHFGNKQDLFTAVLSDVPLTRASVESSLREIQALAPRDGLVAIGTRQLEGLMDHIVWLRLQMMEPGSVPPTLRLPGFRFRDLLTDCLRHWQEMGALRRDIDPKLASEAFADAIFGFVLANKVVFPSDNHPSPKAFLQAFVDVYLSGMEEAS